MDVMNLPPGPNLVDASLYSAILVLPLRFYIDYSFRDAYGQIVTLFVIQWNLLAINVGTG